MQQANPFKEPRDYHLLGKRHFPREQIESTGPDWIGASRKNLFGFLTDIRRSQGCFYSGLGRHLIDIVGTTASVILIVESKLRV